MSKIKLAVVGSRTISDKEKLYLILDKNISNIDYIVSGGADGADSLADEYCREKGLSIKIHYPQWYNNGVYFKGAGFVRNKKIVEEADHVICFWDGVSRGCMNSIDWAKKLEKPFNIIQCDNPLKDYHIFAASTSLLSPFNIVPFDDKSKNIKFESVYQGYCWYFSKFINNENLQQTALTKKYQKSFENIINDSIIGQELWNRWLELEQKTLKYLYKIKLISISDLKDELLETQNKKIIFANTDMRFGCGLKRNEIKDGDFGAGQNIIGKVLETLRNELNGGSK